MKLLRFLSLWGCHGLLLMRCQGQHQHTAEPGRPLYRTLFWLTIILSNTGFRGHHAAFASTLDDLTLDNISNDGEGACSTSIICDEDHPFADHSAFLDDNPATRVYPKYAHAFPCISSDEPGNDRGFFYVKIPRTGSTTIAGVARRIAQHHSNHNNSNGVDCKVRVGHGCPRNKFDYQRRDPTQSFLWTFVRDPKDRALSSFFYHVVSKNGLNGMALDEKFRQWSKRTVHNGTFANYQTEYLRLRDMEKAEDVVPHILGAYDFVGVSERMEESLVVLMLLLDLTMTDILYLSSKRQGYAYTSDSNGTLKCIETQPKQVSETTSSFFDSREWNEANLQDQRLHQAADNSLDLTIDALGREEFNNQLALFRQALKQAQQLCESEAIFPCTTVGKPNENHTCYARDEGCGYSCLDRVGGDVINTSAARQTFNLSLTSEQATNLCSYDMLYSAFAKSNVERGERRCWKFEEEILRIPDSSIVVDQATKPLEMRARLTMRSATIQLSPHSSCRCHVSRTRKIAFDSSKKASFLFLSSFKAGVELRGLMPRWGEISLEYPDGTSGSIFPALPSGTEYKPLEEILTERTLDNFMSPIVSEKARFWLPLVETLEFAEEIGLSFHSIPRKSVGIMSSGSEHSAVLIDVDFLSAKHEPNCTTENADGCAFCSDDRLPNKVQKDYFSGEMFKRRNCEELVTFLFSMDKHIRWDSREIKNRLPVKSFGEGLRRLLYKEDMCTAKCVAEYIRHFLAKQDTAPRALSSPDSSVLCTFDMLNAAFGKKNDTLLERKSNCWSLQEEILRIPVASFVHPESMEMLGMGTEGVVHKALISLDGQEGGATCKAAIKTGICHVDGRVASCLHPKATKARIGVSPVDLEYIGALLFYVAFKAGIELPGLLPTWGVVSDETFVTGNRVPQMKAIVMPLVEMDTLQSLYDANKIGTGSLDEMIPDAQTMAELLLPVLDVLLFAENLGLSFQDLHAKNVGLSVGSHPRAFVFDSTHLRFVDTNHCQLDDKQRACQFCFEYIFHKDQQDPGFTTSMTRQKDCKNFLRLFWVLFKKNDKTIQDPLWKKMQYLLYTPAQCSLSTVKNILVDCTVDRKSRLPFLSTGQDFELLSTANTSVGEPADESAYAVSLIVNEETFKLSLAERLKLWNISIYDKNNETTRSLIQSSTLSWTTSPTHEHAGTGFLANQSLYVETNGTVTLLLNTCNGDTLPKKHFTLIQAQNGCLAGNCNLEILDEGILQAPSHCTNDTNDAAYDCPCYLDEPVMWYDKPLAKWRILVNQRLPEYVDGVCRPSSEAHETSGGYAETLGESATDPWNYNFLDHAYGQREHFYDHKNRRALRRRKMLERRSPQIILSELGGLDGGFLLNDVCEMLEEDENEDEFENYTSTEVLCGRRKVQIARSVTTRMERSSGLIYIQYHAETVNRTYPEALGPRGRARARHLASQFDGHVNPAPKTIIAPLVEDNTRRGQRLCDMVKPLAEHLGITLTIGPTLVDTPRWSPEGARKVAEMALAALHDGPVMVSFWSYAQALCAELGTECRNFEEPGRYHVLHVVEGKVVAIEQDKFDQFGDSCSWDEMNVTRRSWYEALGYNQEIWDDTRGGRHKQKLEDLEWDDMTKEERYAVTSLGFEKQTWQDNCTTFQLLVPEERVYCTSNEPS